MMVKKTAKSKPNASMRGGGLIRNYYLSLIWSEWPAFAQNYRDGQKLRNLKIVSFYLQVFSATCSATCIKVQLGVLVNFITNFLTISFNLDC
jgi:hypothetical protein